MDADGFAWIDQQDHEALIARQVTQDELTARLDEWAAWVEAQDESQPAYDRLAWVRPTPPPTDEEEEAEAARLDAQWSEWQARSLAATGRTLDGDELRRWLMDGEPVTVEPTPPTRPKAVDLPAIALAVSREQAAQLLGVSPDTFKRHVLPDLRVTQVGARQLVPIRELEAWLDRNTARALRES